MDYGDPIYFTFFAVNGAGSGTQANFKHLFRKESGLCTSVMYPIYLDDLCSQFTYHMFSSLIAVCLLILKVISQLRK